jgi:hypothetical protein
LRLHIGWSAFSHENAGKGMSNGVGTMQVGGKIMLYQKKYNHAAPGVAIQHEA